MYANRSNCVLYTTVEILSFVHLSLSQIYSPHICLSFLVFLYFFICLSPISMLHSHSLPVCMHLLLCLWSLCLSHSLSLVVSVVFQTHKSTREMRARLCLIAFKLLIKYIGFSMIVLSQEPMSWIIHSLTYWIIYFPPSFFIHSLTYWIVYSPLLHSLIDVLTHLLPHWLTNSFTPSLTYWLISLISHRRIESFNLYFLIGGLTHVFPHWRTNSFISLTDVLTHLPLHWRTDSFISL